LKYRLKYRIKRALVKWSSWKRKIDNKFESKKTKLTPFEEKAIQLWRLTLKDKDAQLAYNSFGIRQLDKENLSIIFKPSGNSDYIMTILDVTEDRKSVFEIHIPNKHADDVCDYFDMELERRMKEVEDTKKTIISGDLDRLLEQEERELNRKKRKNNVIKSRNNSDSTGDKKTS
jgi:hypothetical protein